MNILGISSGFHDAAVSVIDSHGEILYAAHSERYSKIKHHSELCDDVLSQVLRYGPVVNAAYYEKPWLRQLRDWYSGQSRETSVVKQFGQLKRQLKKHGIKPRIQTWPHHLSHAAAGFQTSDFDRATVVVVDAVGEWDTTSIWAADYDQKGRARYRKLWSRQYPHSIGLFYSAVTQRLGLRPMDEEYIVMGMAAWGQSSAYTDMAASVIDNNGLVKFKQNFHLGLDDDWLENYCDSDLACAAQMIAEQQIENVMKTARSLGWSSNLVYMGGVALNCLANRNLGKFFDRIWIMPCPGDAGSSLGAAALTHGGKIHWRDAYLGSTIPGPYPVENVIHELLHKQIVGVASGRAEFGPRALGNRSLLADPRGPDIKDRVNEIKRRQKFRPFAPVILEEMVHEYFDMPPGWDHCRYMQSVAGCRYPDRYPAVCHVDGTSRVQTVPRDGSGIRKLLEAWHAETGCPMLLNTSLNVRGEPMVNNRADADRFQEKYKIKVWS